MTVAADIREQVRRRASLACEFCGVTETDTGGQLTWNPRREPAALHFLEMDDGTLHPLTSVGAFTLQRLRLNRSPLVAYRLRRRQQAEETRLLTRYRDLVQLLEQLQAQLSLLMDEQRGLLEEQRKLLGLLLDREE